MTIRVHREVSRDLGRHPGWPLFSQLAQEALPVCAVTLIWDSPVATRDELAKESTIDLIDHVHALQRATDQGVISFFVHLTAQPKSAAVLHRKIWKTYALANAPTGVERGPETLIDCGSHVRFTSWGANLSHEVAWLIGHALAFEIAIPLLLPKHVVMREEMAIAWCRMALPPGGCSRYADFLWPQFVTAIAGLGGICIRKTYLDRQLAVDFFAADSLAERMAQVLVPIRGAH